MKRQNKKNSNINWIIKLIILAFTISIFFSFISETAIPNLNILLGILVTILFIFIGVIFDMIGVAVTAADVVPFHSMAAKKVKSARTAILLKSNADKVSSFCCDVVGDICGIISGSTGAVISLKISSKTNWNSLIVTLVVMGIISSLTIGGKALEKGLALKKSNKILYNFAKALNIFIKK